MKEFIKGFIVFRTLVFIVLFWHMADTLVEIRDELKYGERGTAADNYLQAEELYRRVQCEVELLNMKNDSIEKEIDSEVTETE